MNFLRLNASVPNNEIFSEVIYNVFRCERNYQATGNTRGGRVLLAVIKKFRGSIVMLLLVVHS